MRAVCALAVVTFAAAAYADPAFEEIDLVSDGADLYFTAGINDEADGLFGFIRRVKW